MTGEIIFLSSFLSLCQAGFLDSLTLRCLIPDCESPPPGCRMYVTKDDTGCPTGCDYACGAPWCGPRPCSKSCNHGYELDAMGCNTCSCKNGCLRKKCINDCPRGFAADINGCQTCDCKYQFPSCLSWMTCDQGLCPDSCKCQPDCFDAYPLPDNPVVFAL